MDEIDRLIKRCADQVAAELVFRHLPPSEEISQQLWWDPLFRRVVKQIILPQLCKLAVGTPRTEQERRDAEKRRRLCIRTILTPKPGPEEEDVNTRVALCMAAILAVSKRFTYMRLDQAITYFTKACHFNKDYKEHINGVSLETRYQYDSLESLESTEEDSECVQEREEEEETKRVQQQKRRSLHGLDESAEPAAKRLEPNQQRREQLWLLLLERLPSREHATKFFILDRLYKQYDRPGRWKEIADLVLRDRCGILTDDDLPGDVSFEEVGQVFLEMARKSRYAREVLTDDALRQFHCRMSKQLGISTEDTNTSREPSMRQIG